MKRGDTADGQETTAPQTISELWLRINNAQAEHVLIHNHLFRPSVKSLFRPVPFRKLAARLRKAILALRASQNMLEDPGGQAGPTTQEKEITPLLREHMSALLHALSLLEMILDKLREKVERGTGYRYDSPEYQADLQRYNAAVAAYRTTESRLRLASPNRHL